MNTVTTTPRPPRTTLHIQVYDCGSETWFTLPLIEVLGLHNNVLMLRGILPMLDYEHWRERKDMTMTRTRFLRNGDPLEAVEHHPVCVTYADAFTVQRDYTPTPEELKRLRTRCGRLQPVRLNPVEE